MVLVVLAGGALIFDGGRVLTARRQISNVAEAAARAGVETAGPTGLEAETARAATQAYLAAAGAAAGDVVAIHVTRTSVTVSLRTSRSGVFTGLLGGDRLTVTATGRAVFNYTPAEPP